MSSEKIAAIRLTKRLSVCVRTVRAFDTFARQTVVGWLPSPNLNNCLCFFLTSKIFLLIKGNIFELFILLCCNFMINFTNDFFKPYRISGLEGMSDQGDFNSTDADAIIGRTF